jgi:hypothetical protein
MPEIAVAIDVDQSDWSLLARASERAHEDRAVATDNEGELASTPYIADGLGQREIEVPHGSTVAYARPNLRLPRVDRASQIRDGRRADRL